MKACTRCPYPVAGKDAIPDPDVSGKVMHRECPETPPPPPRRGKLHPAAMRLMQVAKNTGDMLRELREFRDLVEHGKMGTKEALDLAGSIEALADETTGIVREAIRARED